MASNTERLGLLKKDSATEGTDTFNVKTMLNDNWDKIDKEVALIDPLTGKLKPGQFDPEGSGLVTEQEVNDKVEALAGPGNSKTVKQLDDAITTHAIDYAKHPAIVTATNTGNAYSVVLNSTPPSYVNGMGLVVTIPADSTGAATVDVNGLGVKDIKKANGDVVDDLKVNGIYTLRYNDVTGAFTLQGEGGLSSADLSRMIADINTLVKM